MFKLLSIKIMNQDHKKRIYTENIDNMKLLIEQVYKNSKFIHRIYFLFFFNCIFKKLEDIMML